jgi:hypothetical protein
MHHNHTTTQLVNEYANSQAEITLPAATGVAAQMSYVLAMHLFG